MAHGYGRWSMRVPSTINHGHQPSAISHVGEALRFWSRRGRFAGVQTLDHVGREVEAGRGPGDARLARVEHEVEPLLRRERVDDRRQLLHEVVLYFLLQLVDLGLRVLLEALGLLLLPLDLF